MTICQEKHYAEQWLEEKLGWEKIWIVDLRCCWLDALGMEQLQGWVDSTENCTTVTDALNRVPTA